MNIFKYSYPPANYFLTKNKPLIIRIWKYSNVKNKVFGFDKSILKISHTNMEFILLVHKTINGFSKGLRIVLLEYATG